MTTAPTSSSAQSSTNPSPVSGPASVQQLHHPNAMAHVEVPKGVENIPQGMSVMGGSALLAKKMAASGSSFYSPTDTLVSPCTQKLHLQKGKRWANVKSKAPAFGPSSLANVTTAPSSAGFLHPAHAAAAANQLAFQASIAAAPASQPQKDGNGDTEMEH